MASEKYTWFLTATAEGDIDDILSYIAGVLHNPEAAAAFADKLEEELDTLCKSPKNGRLVENDYLRRDDVRRILIDNYIAYYIINEKEKAIIVLRVVYGKRDQTPIVSSFDPAP